MFYSETLLAKTGPLARVWLAANLERKLSKQTVLASNLENNVKDIIGQGQAPMALRLSGQLLLGVVKIYSRKAKYLLDDCSDALAKIKIAFRPANVDLPTSHSHAANPSNLILPDDIAVADIDLFAPLPDPEDLLRDEPTSRGAAHDPTLLPDLSQLLPDSTPRRQQRHTFALADDDDLGIDFGLDAPDEGLRMTPGVDDQSIEVGRRAQTPRRDEPTLMDDMDLGLDFGDNDDTTAIQPTTEGGFNVPMLGDEFGHKKASLSADQRQRDSASPLSELDDAEAHSLEETFRLQMEDDDEQAQAPLRVKRRKVMRQDNETQLHNSQIKAQQEDRSGITRQPTFLPRDPVLLHLMELQRTGSFVSNLMGDGRLAGLAPELRGILSLEVVTRANDKKRKRDSGVADMETDGERVETPQLDIQQDDEAYFAGGDDQLVHQDDDDEPAAPLSPGLGAFDDTEAPLLHPSQSGPVSQGTKTAVHLLRNHLIDPSASPSSAPSSQSRTKQSLLFTELCPEKSTSRHDATKIFFELLVLGTKDAIKVEQDPSKLGGSLRVRGKRGLWEGKWAELDEEAEADVEAGAEEIEA